VYTSGAILSKYFIEYLDKVIFLPYYTPGT
jgi:hypothetical protein